MGDCYCGADCWVADAKIQDDYGECDGDIEVVDEVQHGEYDYGWVHSCQSHLEKYWEIY